MIKKALITGITGMVGSHLADFLLENTNWEVYGVCRWRSPLDNVNHLLNRVNEKDRIYFDYADLNDEISLITMINKVKPDYVFHLAAQSYPLTSFTAPIDTLNTNILGTCRLLEAIRAAMEFDEEYKPVIHVCASSEIFGKIPSENKPEAGIHEECQFHPASPYAISKVGTDLLGRYYAEAYGMTIMTTRMFTHTGPRRGDVFHESTFAKQIAMIEAGMIEPKVMVGNLKSLRTYADVRDAVRAYNILVTVNPIGGEYYNIGGVYTCEVGDTLDILISYSTMKDKIQIVTDPKRLRPIDADLQVPNCRKFKEHTGWEPEISFETTMLGGQGKIAALMQVFAAAVIIVILQFVPVSPERVFSIICVAIYMVVFNAQCFLGYTFQAVNLIKYYSKAIMIDKLCYIAALIIMLLLQIKDFRVYIVCYIATCTLSLIYLVYKGNRMVFARIGKIKEVIAETIDSLKNGINLMTASVASSLVIGTSRLFVDYAWGIEEFGKISFALSLTNFLLLFIRQIGLVLFPVLCRESRDIQIKTYYTIKSALKLLFPLIFLMYIPAKVILSLWLPEYKESLIYLAFLLPLCAFDAEMQINGTTYLKILRKEKQLFGINLLAVCINVVMISITVLLFKSIYAIIIIIVITIALRSGVAGFIAEKNLGITKRSIPIKEFVLSMIYFVIVYRYTEVQAFFLYMIIYAIYLFAERNKIKDTFILLKSLKIN